MIADIFARTTRVYTNKYEYEIFKFCAIKREKERERERKKERERGRERERVSE